MLWQRFKLHKFSIHANFNVSAYCVHCALLCKVDLKPSSTAIFNFQPEKHFANAFSCVHIYTSTFELYIQIVNRHTNIYNTKKSLCKRRTILASIWLIPNFEYGIHIKCVGAVEELCTFLSFVNCSAIFSIPFQNVRRHHLEKRFESY